MKSKILFVDDEKEILASMEKIFSTNTDFQLFYADNVKEALSVLNREKIDLIISDQSMPEMTGIEMFIYIKKKFPDTLRILLTGHSDLALAIAAVNDGEIYRYITKPWDILELRSAVDKALEYINLKKENKEMIKKIERHNLDLEIKVRQRTTEISEVQDVAIFSLAKLAESRDPETGKHLMRIREYCRHISSLLVENNIYKNIIDKVFIENIYISSPLHDIGKVGIPDHILLKPGKLSAEEFEIMKTHSSIGGKTLEDAENRLKKNYDKETFLTMSKEIAFYHHEKWNGSGYPFGLSEQKIPLCARITGLADAYDALTTKRPYKDPFSHEKTMDIIRQERGKQFDPAIIDVFAKISDDFRMISEKYKDK